MGQRNLTRVRPAKSNGSDWSTAGEGRVTVVVADSGASAEVLVLSSDQPIGRGTEFQHRGTTWVITGAQRDSGILVAEPTAH